MRDFFRGWRRKVGCGVFVVALLFVGGWIRSFRLEDFLSLPLPFLGRSLEIHSFRGRIEAGIRWSNKPSTFPHFAAWRIDASYQEPHVDSIWFFDFESSSGGSFDRGGLVEATDSVIFRYYAVAIYLTLFAACCFLWMPPKQEQAKYKLVELCLLWMVMGIVPIAILFSALMYFYGPQENTSRDEYSETTDPE